MLLFVMISMSENMTGIKSIHHFENMAEISQLALPNGAELDPQPTMQK